MGGNTKISIYDIARELDISVSTVSRALKGNKSISAKTAQRVLDMAHKLNYTPNAFAVNLKNGKTNTIGVVVPDISIKFFSCAIDGIEQEAYAAGYDVMIYQTHESIDNEKRVIENLLKGKIDGVAVSLSSSVSDFAHWSKLVKYNVPLVFFDRSVNMEGVGSVTVNDYRGACEAVKHLIDQGYKKIYHCAGIPGVNIWDQRRMGYIDTMKRHGIAIKDNWIYEADPTEENGSKYIEYILSTINGEVPEAIFFAGDYPAIGAMNKLYELGYSVPDDVAIVGFVNDTLCRYMKSPLTSVEQFPLRMGQVSCKLLIDRINGEESRNIILPTQLIIRKSSIKNNQ